MPRQYGAAFLFSLSIYGVPLHMKKLSLLALLFMGSIIVPAQTPVHYIFKNHRDGYNMFRIPAIVATNSGKLLAFCEGRKSLMDHGDIDLVMKTSADSGKTWSALQVIWNDGTNTCGNPAPIVDKTTGHVLVAATLNNDKVFILRTSDEGATWQAPLDITIAVKPTGWQWYATGPGHSIQLQSAAHHNRIVVPCNHTTTTNPLHVSHIIYSDDSGYTWQQGGEVNAAKTDECTVAELTNGNLLLNMRNNQRPLPNRKTAISTNGGLTWSPPAYDSTLIEPVCQGTLLRYDAHPGVLLFCNPAHTTKRKNLTLYVSHTNGTGWQHNVTVHKKLSAYNDIVTLPNGDVLCLFETGKLLPYGGIAITTIAKEKIILATKP
jgi:sialidase-1